MMVRCINVDCEGSKLAARKSDCWLEYADLETSAEQAEREWREADLVPPAGCKAASAFADKGGVSDLERAAKVIDSRVASLEVAWAQQTNARLQDEIGAIIFHMAHAATAIRALEASTVPRHERQAAIDGGGK